MLLLIFIFVVFIFLAQYNWNRRRSYALSWQAKGPLALPIIGNGYLCTKASEMIPTFTSLFEKYGPVFRFWIGPRLFLFFSDPDDIETILASKNSIDRADSYSFFERCIGGPGLLTNGGATWKSHRKLLNPTVQHYKILKRFYLVFNEHIKTLIGILQHKDDGKSFNIYNFIEACTLDTICETLFGQKMNFQESQQSFLFIATTKMMEMASLVIFMPWLQNSLIFRMTKYHKMLFVYRDHGREIIFDIIKKRAEELKAAKPENVAEEKQQNIFIDECLKLSWETDNFQIEDVLNEAVTMMTAGFETTAVTVSNIVLMMALHPEYQEKVFEEIKTIFPDQNSDVTYEDLQKLSYTECFIKESMRLNASIPIIGRTAKSDTQIRSLHIPAGTELALSFFNLHRNKNVWGPRANEFNPDNFLPENMANRHPSAFLPFGGGLRNCIGYKFAHILIRIFVCWLVRHYRFTTDLKMEDLSYRLNITIYLLNKHIVYVHKRLNY